MLDELMGKERNVPLTERTGRALKYSDAEICKYELAGLCPYGLFRNTKSDLGERAPASYRLKGLSTRICCGLTFSWCRQGLVNTKCMRTICSSSRSCSSGSSSLSRNRRGWSEHSLDTCQQSWVTLAGPFYCVTAAGVDMSPSYTACWFSWSRIWIGK